jgi:hypothetical protein
MVWLPLIVVYISFAFVFVTVGFVVFHLWENGFEIVGRVLFFPLEAFCCLVICNFVLLLVYLSFGKFLGFAFRLCVLGAFLFKFQISIPTWDKDSEGNFCFSLPGIT